MIPQLVVQIALLLVVVLALARPLGSYMARIADAENISGPVGRLENAIYRVSGIHPGVEMSWRQYAGALVAMNFLGLLALYTLLRLQGWLPLNPFDAPSMPSLLALNAAISFATNTNWQAYAGEAQASLLSQTAGFAVQNFLSAGTGLAVAFALARGLRAGGAGSIGNYWRDLVRSVLYVLLPLCIVGALFYVSQGVPQTWGGEVASDVHLPLGPVASQVAIKQLGTNGGGFYNANAAHPGENPTPLANFASMVSILLIPVAICFTFGRMVGSLGQGRMILSAMGLLFLTFMTWAIVSEMTPHPDLARLGVDAVPSALQSGGFMEGKESRIGAAQSAIWAAATTATSSGSVNSMHDSYSPFGGLATMALMQLGEVAFGGVGSGLYGMALYVLIAVFIAGLMVGRTPEYLGKKIEAHEIKLAMIAVLMPAVLVLCGAAFAFGLPGATPGTSLAHDIASNPGPHALSEVLYAFSSMGNNNGSAFAGVLASHPYMLVAGAAAMFVGRFVVIVSVLGIAGSLARKKAVPAGPGTLPTDTPLFIFLLYATVVLEGALIYVPALSLGPVVEHLQLFR